VAGNLDITYGWQDAWVNVKDQLPDADVQYMQPVEGRLSWVCGYVLMKNTKRVGLAHEMMNCIPTAQNALALINGYFYGAAGAGSPDVLGKVERKELIPALGLDDLEAALTPPKTWVLQYIPNRAEYVKAAEEVKAA
jgi:spermidine/putrescine-binding protein